MSLVVISVFAVIGLAAGWLAPPRWRVWLLLGVSVLAGYWLQPSSPIRYLDFWLPTASILLTILTWAATRSQQATTGWRAWIAAGLTLALILVVAGLRYTGAVCCVTASRPPDLLRVLLVLGLAGLLVLIPIRFPRTQRFFAAGMIILILGLFIVLKSPALGQQASVWLRAATGQSLLLAAAGDLPWLGFSYLAFRLLHVLRDFQGGKLPPLALDEFVTYALFFPTYAAGPIDRAPRFAGDLRLIGAAALEKVPARPDPQRQEQIVSGGWRISVGLFKKFVIADGLAIIALNSQNAGEVSSSLWMWVLLYAYALRIYFDFAGYTDIALGIGRLAGIRLPENFDRPYLKQNLTAFWNSWHMTLAMWFRAYYFNPLTRYLRSRRAQLPTWTIILIGQLTTMLLIGLWHGISWNFFAWGAWHGVGLFVHNRWSDFSKGRFDGLGAKPALQKGLTFGAWLLTFNYVALGWVWFALPEIEASLGVFRTLFGFSG